MIKAKFNNGALYADRGIYSRLKLIACENTIRTLLSVAEKKGMIRYRNNNIIVASFSKLMREHNINPVKCILIDITSAHALADVMDILRSEIIKDNINKQQTIIHLRDKLNASTVNMTVKQAKKVMKTVEKFKPSAIATRKIFVTSRKTAQWLKVSNATAVEILKRLNDKGLIKIQRHVEKFYLKEILDPKLLYSIKFNILGYRYNYNNILYIDRGYIFL